ncbi:MAG: hypothetical protein JWO60_2204 [Frankiales bacterium]|nr:hypothetical protein [Frankiales bacterium]
MDVVEADVVALAQSLGRAGMLDGVAPELVEVSADAG